MFARMLILVAVVGVIAAACSSTDQISAETCPQLADESMALFQRLIDNVDAEVGDLTVEEFIESGADLPSIETFEQEAAVIDEIASTLGCSQSEISGAVSARVGELTARTDLGRFLIGGLRSGGL